jgi:hypothetical protein
MDCSICGNKTAALGLCTKHYYRFRKYGSATATGTKPHGTPEERFWAKVQKSDECWLWIGGKTRAGYGVIQEGGKGSKTLLAHRLSYTLHKGPIADGLHVLHSCDNPSCVNPEHLRCGTNSENMQDAYDRGRKVTPFTKKENRRQGPGASLPGSKNPNAKLTEDDIRAIRSSGKRPTEIAKDYNMTVAGASQILLRKSWRHVT